MAANETFELAAKAYTDMDHEAAFPLMKQCAESGDARACFILSLMYSAGEGTERSEGEASYWLNRLEELAKAGQAEAQWELSCKYRYGNRYPLDVEKANYWLLQAASNGCAEAQFHLSRYIEEAAYGFSRSLAEASQWFVAALKQEYPEAIYVEALRHYRDGRPTEHALALLRRAATKGFQPARRALETAMF